MPTPNPSLRGGGRHSMSITPNVIRVIAEGELALAVGRTLGIFAE